MTTVTVHPALAELESRAGASDKDRSAWLAERRSGVTATEIRDLYLKGAGYRAELLKEKAAAAVFVNAKTTGDSAEFKPGSSFVANQYTAWGKKREPVIARWADQRFAIADESRVFHAADNPRFLASPDGVGVDFDGNLVIDEIKTGKDDLRPSGEAYARKGYGIQQCWGMRVTGARRSKYIWEQHDSNWQDRGGDFLEPAPLHPEPLAEWIEYDETLAAELEAIAIAFLADLDALVSDLAGGVEAQIDDVLDTHAVNYLRFIGLEKEATTAKKTEWAAMLERLEGCDPLSQEGPIARVTYNPGEERESETADVEAAKEADPELFAEVQALSKRWNEHQKNYQKSVVTPAKPSLTVTAVKATKEKKA
jgi:hypothetical protein